jgi:hypothetical protein
MTHPHPTSETRTQIGGDEYDDDYHLGECANCGSEGVVYGCSWDWQCDHLYAEVAQHQCLCVEFATQEPSQ